MSKETLAPKVSAFRVDSVHAAALTAGRAISALNLDPGFRSAVAEWSNWTSFITGVFDPLAENRWFLTADQHLDAYFIVSVNYRTYPPAHVSVPIRWFTDRDAYKTEFLAKFRAEAKGALLG